MFDTLFAVIIAIPNPYVLRTCDVKYSVNLPPSLSLESMAIKKSISTWGANTYLDICLLQLPAEAI